MIVQNLNAGSLKALLSLLTFAFFNIRSEGQVAKNVTFSVNVKDTSGVPIVGAMVLIINDSDSLVFQQITDASGQVIVRQKTGSYTVWVENFSYETAALQIHVSEKTNTVGITLNKSTYELEEVVVVGGELSTSQRIRQATYAPEVIDIKELRSTARTVVEAINSVPGLRIQQQGGSGSPVNIILNGIDGKDVRVFIDEVPVYLLGRGFELQNLSLNMIDRIEIYKGLIPIQFGSDALGGVINIVSVKNEEDILEMGYTYGSWNYHEASLRAYSHPFRNKKLFTGFDAVYRHSDNNFWMDDVDIIVDDLYNTRKGRARRFNDEYDFCLGRIQIGYEGLRWADHIRLISSITYTKKEWQHGITAIQPWGQPHSMEYTGGVAVNWKKSGSEKKRWQIDATAGYNFEQSYFVDTSSRTYFWNGSFVTGSNGGESGLYNKGRTPKIDQNVLYGRESIFFRIGNLHKVNISFLTTYRRLTGEDKAGTVTYKQDPFEDPQVLVNNFSGVSLESKLLHGRIIGNTSFKHYYSKVRGVGFKVNNEFDKTVTSSSSDIGLGYVFKWLLSQKLSISPGYEYTIRQPDNRELFGDYITISPNPNLKPAGSHNINLKVHYKSMDEKVFTGISGFYRNTKNRIVLTSFTNALAAYTNLMQTSAIGSEYFFHYKPDKAIDVSFNATYQDIRLRDVDELGVFTDKYIGARVPNIPYLFSNAQGAYTWDPGSNKSYYVRLLYAASYVHEYFLTWAMNGKKSSKVIIPSQIVNDISISIHAKNRKWSFSIDCKNLTNARLYDSFSVQKPGRSFYGKFNYSIAKSK